MGMDGGDPQAAITAPSGTPARRRALACEQKAMAWELLLSRSWSSWCAGASGGQWRWWRWGSTMPRCLAAADLGIAVATGTQIAQDTADL